MELNEMVFAGDMVQLNKSEKISQDNLRMQAKKMKKRDMETQELELIKQDK